MIHGKVRGNGGQAGGEIWVYIEFIAARLPTLQIRCEKKVIPYLKFNTPGQYPLIEKLSTTNMPRKARFFISKIPVHLIIRGNSEHYLLSCYRYIPDVCASIPIRYKFFALTRLDAFQPIFEISV